MLINHPHIRRSHLREETNNAGHITQTLVVETDLPLPRSKTYADTSKDFEGLIDYLTHLAASDFTYFSKLEIKAYKKNMSLNEKVA